VGDRGHPAQGIVTVGVVGLDVINTCELADQIVAEADRSLAVLIGLGILNIIIPDFGRIATEIVVLKLPDPAQAVDPADEVPAGVVDERAGVAQFVGLFHRAAHRVVDPSGGVAFRVGEREAVAGRVIGIGGAGAGRIGLAGEAAEVVVDVKCRVTEPVGLSEDAAKCVVGEKQARRCKRDPSWPSARLPGVTLVPFPDDVGGCSFVSTRTSAAMSEAPVNQ